MHPGNLSKITSKEVEAIKPFYGSDLPNPSSFEAEVELRKENFSSDDVSRFDKMKLSEILPLVYKDFFPNALQVLKFASLFSSL